METTGPEAVPVHSKENPPGHRGVPTTEEVKAQTRSAAALVLCPNRVRHVLNNQKYPDLCQQSVSCL